MQIQEINIKNEKLIKKLNEENLKLNRKNKQMEESLQDASLILDEVRVTSSKEIELKNNSIDLLRKANYECEKDNNKIRTFNSELNVKIDMMMKENQNLILAHDRDRSWLLLTTISTMVLFISTCVLIVKYLIH